MMRTSLPTKIGMSCLPLALILHIVNCNAENKAPIASNNSAPVVEATAEVNAALIQKITKLEAKVGKLELRVGDSAGGNIWNIGTGGAGMAGMLLLYMLSERFDLTRRIKAALKGKTCQT